MQPRSGDNVFGIDVSRHQGEIDWPKVSRANVKYAFIKATEGGSYLDPMFRRNAMGADAVGVPMGFYHYARPELGNSAEKEAKHFIETVKQYKPKMPHVLDVEGEANKLGKAALTQWSKEWMDYVSENTGHPVMLYTGGYFAKTYLDKPLNIYPIWIAHYGTNDPMNNTTWTEWAVFQYTSSGKVDGIKGNVDLNVMEKGFYDKMMGSASVKKTPFKDVPAGHYSEEAIEMMRKLGIINGKSATVFGFGEPVKREDLAVILDRFYDYVTELILSKGGDNGGGQEEA